MLRKFNCLDALQSAGISYEDACALRRISMTLQRWYELECGDGNSYGSWAIVRGRKVKRIKDHIPTLSGERETFEYDDDGKPYMEHHHYRHGAGKDTVTYTPMADRERGALKRLDKLMARYPGFGYHVQGDPRGCALYIMTPVDLLGFVNRPGDGTSLQEWIFANYNRGIAVHK